MGITECAPVMQQDLESVAGTDDMRVRADSMAKLYSVSGKGWTAGQALEETSDPPRDG